MPAGGVEAGLGLAGLVCAGVEVTLGLVGAAVGGAGAALDLVGMFAGVVGAALGATPPSWCRPKTKQLRGEASELRTFGGRYKI